MRWELKSQGPNLSKTFGVGKPKSKAKEPKKIDYVSISYVELFYVPPSLMHTLDHAMNKLVLT